MNPERETLPLYLAGGRRGLWHLPRLDGGAPILVWMLVVSMAAALVGWCS